MAFRTKLAALLLGFALSVPATALQAETAFEEGERLAQAGDFDGAMAAYGRATTEEPTSTLAYTRLGGMQLVRQQTRDSIQSFRKAIGLDPENADAFVGMGMAYLHSGDYALARAAFSEAARIRPAKQPEIDEVLAWIDTREGKVQPGHP
jgi:cytochrome c-type biogenesis protein CcmH/NrfG